MMDLTGLAVAVILALIAAVHFHWAVGGIWPARDEGELARMVVGDPRVVRMPPPGLTLAVVAALAGAALIALLLRWPMVFPKPLVASAGLILTAVFLARGIAGYVPAWQRRHAAQPFASLDRRYFSPLCLALGFGFALLLLNM